MAKYELKALPHRLSKAFLGRLQEFIDELDEIYRDTPETEADPSHIALTVSYRCHQSVMVVSASVTGDDGNCHIYTFQDQPSLGGAQPTAPHGAGEKND